MELAELGNYAIVDCHTHFGGADLDAIDGMLGRLEDGGIERLGLVVTSVPGRVNSNAEGIYAKAKHPDRVYLFMGMDYSAVAQDVDHRLTYSLAQQIDRLIALGADGVKMINGKPNTRKASGIALDSVIYDDYFARLEERKFPILWHVNDPEEFWNPEQAPEWAKGPGWLYDDTFPTKESLYQECERVLAKHPRLRIMFAHFYFLSDDLPRAAQLLERYPDVHLDLAPGIEMLYNFTKRPKEAREFFITYQDRIVFGTDFFTTALLSRVWVMRNFLETDELFHVPTDDRLFWPDHRSMIQGIALPPEVLKKIYAGNYERLVSAKPRALNLPAALAELDRLTALYDQLGQPKSAARRVAAYLAETMANTGPAEEED
ncbi:MAG: amidohydrolase family protein [Armatimonadota bacterium]